MMEWKEDNTGRILANNMNKEGGPNVSGTYNGLSFCLFLSLC